MDVQLTKDAEFMLDTLYKAYLMRRENNISKSVARCFGGSGDIHHEFFPFMAPDDVLETFWELSRAGLALYSSGDDAANNIRISDIGIIFMEQRFTRTLASAITTVSKLRP